MAETLEKNKKPELAGKRKNKEKLAAALRRNLQRRKQAASFKQK